MSSRHDKQQANIRSRLTKVQKQNPNFKCFVSNPEGLMILSIFIPQIIEIVYLEIELSFI